MYVIPLQGTCGGVPMKPVSQSHLKPPFMLVQRDDGPQGLFEHSSTSSHTAPTALKPSLQKHWPSMHSASLTQSKFDLHNVVTSVWKKFFFRIMTQVDELGDRIVDILPDRKLLLD